jgi:hypothetical protein
MVYTLCYKEKKLKEEWTNLRNNIKKLHAELAASSGNTEGKEEIQNESRSISL